MNFNLIGGLLSTILQTYLLSKHWISPSKDPLSSKQILNAVCLCPPDIALCLWQGDSLEIIDGDLHVEFFHGGAPVANTGAH